MRSCLAATLVTLAAGCTAGERADTGECPPNEECSDATPNGLFFVGPSMAGMLFDGSPQVVAIDGTQSIGIQYPGGAAFDLAYRAEAGGAVEVEGEDGATVTVRGANDGGTYLRIIDPSDDTLYDRINVRAESIVDIELVSGTFEVSEPGTTIALAEGTREVGIALHGGFDRLVDESMAIDAPGSERIAWDTIRLPSGALGTYPITVTAAGDAPVTLDAEIVAGADSVAILPSFLDKTYVAGEVTQVCFGAYAGVKQIVGLPWTFTLDGAPLAGGLAPNCAQFTADAQGTFTIVAAAGGHSATAQVQVYPTDRGRVVRGRDPRAGERARGAE